MRLTALAASALIALLDANDAHHAETVRVLASLKPGQLIAHSVNVAESLVAAASIGKEHDSLLRLQALGMRILSGDATEPERIAKLRTSTNLRLPDCYPVDAALTNNAQLLSFDDRQNRAAAHAGVTLAEVPAPEEDEHQADRSA
jgi:predicted nucleic acid-binding protein